MHTLTLRVEEDYYEHVMSVLRQFSSQKVKVEETVPDFIVTSEAEARARIERAMTSETISLDAFKVQMAKHLQQL